MSTELKPGDSDVSLKMRIIGFAIILLLAIPATPGSSSAQSEIQVPYARGGIAGVPNYYVVSPGDTLFMICEAYFQNPYTWPRIWAYNPHITNPHWIYPGDVIFLRPPADPDSAPAPRPPGAPGTHYPLGGFYTGAELDSVGFIRFSPTPHANLGLFDDVYLEFDDYDSVRVGDRFALNTVLDRVYGDDDQIVAVKYRVTGVVEVMDKPEDSPLVVGRIIQAWDLIRRGDVLFVGQRHVRVVEPRPASANIEGSIIDFFEPTTYAAESFYVFIDAGYNQGVREGNRFVIWERYDEYTELLDGEPGFEEEEHAEDMPWRRMGEAMVIFTSNDYATAVLTYSRIELSRGMRATLTEGL
jgi:hypothetical protein